MPVRLAAILIFLLATGVPADEQPDQVQGNWLGTWEGQGGMGGKNVCQIYGLGNGEYQAIFTAYDSGEQDKGEFSFGIRGATTAEAHVVFDQNIDLGGLGTFAFHAEIREGKLRGKYSNGKEYEGTMVLERVRKSPDAVGAKPLPGAISLFDGKTLQGWTVRGDEAGEWRVDGGVITAPTSERLSAPKGGHLACNATLEQAQIHIEFRVPYLPEKRGEKRGQSGIYLLGQYELQIVDSFGLPRAKDAQGYFIDTDALGAFYGRHPPTELPALPPGEWQAFDITIHAAAAESAGRGNRSCEFTVLLNGQLIHERVLLDKPTLNAPAFKAGSSPSLMLQNAGQPVQFRNIWYVPLASSK